MSQPPFQPPPQQPQPMQQTPQPPPMQGKPPKPKRFGFLAMAITALISLGVGGAVIGSGDGTTTAEPQPTVTVTTTAPPDVVEGGSEPEPEPKPTAEKPAAWNPKPKDFKLGIKVTKKECFGEAGCNILYKISLDYLGNQKLPAEGTTDITYQVDGAEDPIIGTITLDGEGKFSANEESASTTSSSKKLTAKVTEVDYNEFG
jgi:hypothetical protein